MPEIRIDVPDFGQRVFVLEQRSTNNKVKVPCGFCGGSDTGEIVGADGTKARCPRRCENGTVLVDAPVAWVVSGTADCEYECDRELYVYQYMLSEDCTGVLLQDADGEIRGDDLYPLSDVFVSEDAAFAAAEERNSKG
jgi:hypothetical protein